MRSSREALRAQQAPGRNEIPGSRVIGPSESGAPTSGPIFPDDTHPRRPSFAVFSGDRRYRYVLWRNLWPNVPAKPARTCCFVLLNPSTADELTDDPTIRRCIAFARSWGDERLLVVNLFALRSTDPAGLVAADDPIGPANDRWIRIAAQSATRVVVAWGHHGAWRARGDQVLELLPRPLYRFGITANGQPRHPLYLRGTSPLEVVS